VVRCWSWALDRAAGHVFGLAPQLALLALACSSANPIFPDLHQSLAPNLHQHISTKNLTSAKLRDFLIHVFSEAFVFFSYRG
jgi:hypothetical protein